MYAVKHVAYKCTPPPQPNAQGWEVLGNRKIYYFPGCKAEVMGSVAMVRCKPDHNPAQYGFSNCVPVLKFFEIRARVKEECINDQIEDGRAYRVVVDCGDKRRVAIYYPSSDKLILLGVDECLEAVKPCLEP